MKSYLIQSFAPLVFRSGKPFGSQMSASDVIFPLPSAGAGLIRSLSIAQQTLPAIKKRFGSVEDALKDDEYKQILSVKSYGVYLAKYGDDGNHTILVPKPANSLYVEKDGNIELVRLAPKAMGGDCGSDLPDGLLYVQTVDKEGKVKAIKGKPKSGINFWTLEHLKKWQQGDDLSYDDIKQDGITSIPTDIRTHVAIDDDTLSSEEGRLFQTASYDMGYQIKPSPEIQKRCFDDKRLGFVVVSEQDLKEDLATFGGERRLSQFLPIKQTVIETAQQKQVDKINQTRGFCLTFITPCVFAQGYLPEWIDQKSMTGKLPDSEIKVRLKAVAIDRWQAVSGWDSLLWKPKAMRKAVSAGSVYWFELIDGDTMDLQTLQRLNLSLADNEYDQNDGFGMASIAPYSFD